MIIVDLPQPDGADIMIILPLSDMDMDFSHFLQHVEHLFLDLLKLVLHLHYKALHLGVIAL